jgi:hypothetical protein
MVRDLLILVVASIVIVWSVLESPQKKPLQGVPTGGGISHTLSADPDLRLISERSEYMRTER